MKLILIGFMGTGKTVIGKKISNKSNIKFVDMDNEIEKRENMTITKIFEINGEQYFRILETKVLKDLLKENNIIISTGGGIVTTDENLDILKKEKNVVFLDGNVETIKRNVSRELDKRPLLKNSSNIYDTIEKLLNQRYDKYNSTCDIKIDINDKNIQEVVSEILVSIR
ncbi:shikimate kinase [Romboutsia lituseburensis]|uniref:shikimate kinase n=1 Tax=Romboutsia lituseburensis TaxID=1537 RepID=UPI00215AD560|nr:shikimate kinase [Romboutsia lituseburensis]MCR8745201.1 shikimate kinase [Romboutsia lituseburensis]